MAEEGSDTQLIEAAAVGDRAAMEELLLRHERRIYDFGLRMCRDETDAEDVLQETLLAAARNLSRFRGDASLSSWLYTIARNACIRSRTRKRDVATDLSEERSDANTQGLWAVLGDDLVERISARDMLRRVQRALDELGPSQKEVLVLRDAEGLSAPEVAAALNISEGAVKSRLHRARAALHERLTGQLTPSPASTCPDIVSLFSKQLEGEIGAATCHEIETHLEACPHCRHSCDAIQRELRLCREAHDRPVPSDVKRRLRAALRACLRSD